MGLQTGQKAGPMNGRGLHIALLGLWPALVMLPVPAAGQSAAPTAAELFRDAELPQGEQLMREHRCAACHVSKVGGDGSAIYRPQGRINSAPLLRGMVQLCSTELNLSLFPEEVTAIAAVLNRDHYRFK